MSRGRSPRSPRWAALALTGLAALLPPQARASGGDEGLLLTAAHAERILLPQGAVPTLEVEALSARVSLRQNGPLDGLAAALSSSEICPEVEKRERRIVLHCRSRRLDARLSRVGGRWALDLRELRGLPWKDGLSAPPITGSAPETSGLGGPCPGTTPAGRGECALTAGDWKKAERHFLEETEQLSWASLRLGDLALLADRPARAAWYYERAVGGNPAGRLAEARLCELLGHCLGTDRAAPLFRSEGLPDGWKEELDLRAARIEAFVGDPTAAARFLLGKMSRKEPSKVCPEGQRVCEAVALAALSEPGFTGKEDALALYFALPHRMSGPGSATLARAAAEVCAGLGAPVFGANLLAATTGAVPGESLEEHLHQAVELYLQGGDRVRAGVVLDYARFRFGDSVLTAPRWSRLSTRLGDPSPGDVPAGVAALATEAAKDSELLRELAQALVAAARARSQQAPTP